MTLEEHAAAIQTAVNNAARDGFHLDDGDCRVPDLDLNSRNASGQLESWIEISVPQ